MAEWLTDLGISVSNAIGGFFGGGVSVFLFRQFKPIDAFGSVFISTCTAGYLGKPIGHYIPVPEGGIGFIVGLCSLYICMAILQAARNWKPTVPGGKPDGAP
jgi:hypothetical protein